MDNYKFIDLFSGCGGLSLGLSLAGLDGQFAIERDPMAFKTFESNMLGERQIPVRKFSWPLWLEKKAWSVDDLLAQHHQDLIHLQGKVQVIAGGPPCQGFSFAGRRQESDPRNLLFEKYVEVVKAVQPLALVLENVPGMKVAHSSEFIKQPSLFELAAQPNSFYDKLRHRLNEAGYEVHGKIINASLFGVPQKRSRLIVMGIKKNLARYLDGGIMQAFATLELVRREQLSQLNLPELISAKDALSDLETIGKRRQTCTDPFSPPGFEEIIYKQPRTRFQQIMHSGSEHAPMDSIRLARHRDDIRERFTKILEECPKGTNINKASRDRYGLNKHRTFLMAPDEAAPTVTTLPDDILHYSEPRILTVRECARLQTFPDWFHFQGKFTTGGSARTKECPRYTQVGNAVPPLLARAIGFAIREILNQAQTAFANEMALKTAQFMAVA